MCVYVCMYVCMYIYIYIIILQCFLVIGDIVMHQNDAGDSIVSIVIYIAPPVQPAVPQSPPVVPQALCIVFQHPSVVPVAQ